MLSYFKNQLISSEFNRDEIKAGDFTKLGMLSYNITDYHYNPLNLHYTSGVLHHPNIAN